MHFNVLRLSGALKLRCYSHAGRPARGGDHTYCGLTGNKSRPEEQKEDHGKTKRQPHKLRMARKIHREL